MRWEKYREGGELRLGGHDRKFQAIVACDGRMCSASFDGTIRVWSRAGALGTWAGLRTVEACGRGTYPFCLAVRGSKLVSGSAGRGQAEVRVWGLAELDLQQTLRQPDDVNALVAMDGEVWGCSEKEVVVWGWRR